VDQHAKRLRELLHAPVIIALPQIAPSERKQLVAHGVPFVVPDCPPWPKPILWLPTSRVSFEKL
jgi:hypothetical protein